MYVEYLHRLPDYEWVPSGHIFRPSGFAGMTFQNRTLSSSATTFIAIRSLKHDKTNPVSHGHDLWSWVEEIAFSALQKTGAGDINTIWIIFTNGGSDESP